MPEPTPDQTLHLPSLVIKNFRGIDDLTIPRLGRVTLLAGKNGVGKTTVLDAVRVWAARGLMSTFDAVLRERGDVLVGVSQNEQRTTVDRVALFTNRANTSDSVISIGPLDNPSATMQLWERRADALGHPLTGSSLDGIAGNIGLVSQFGDNPRVSAMGRSVDVARNTTLIAVCCDNLGPNVPADEIVEQYWSDVALTMHEDRALDALNLVTDARVERVAALGPPVQDGMIQPRRMMAKVTNKDYQVPLRTLGDGAFRAYAVALALAKCSNGFLLIDEAENGLHHSIQAKFWNMVLQTAERNNVQVIATTHSWDCVVGFAQAANELEDVEGLLVRIERPPIGLRPITYDASRLNNIAKHGIEVR